MSNSQVEVSLESIEGELLSLFQVFDGCDLREVFVDANDHVVDHGLKLLFRSGRKHCCSPLDGIIIAHKRLIDN